MSFSPLQFDHAFNALRWATHCQWDESAVASFHEALRHTTPDELTRSAIHHGLAPLLAHHLHRHAPEYVTPALRDYAQRNAIRARFLTQTLLELLADFRAAGLPAVALKGPALAELAYGALDLRDYCDLDVLVHPQQIDEAEQLCRARGFVRKRNIKHMADDAMRPFAYDLPLMRLSDGVVLELHWAMTFRYAGIRFERWPWWEQLQQGTLNGQPIAALGAAETLLLLCLHGSKDGWNQLKAVADVAQLIRVSPDLDWARLWQLARLLNAERLVRIALRLAHELLAAPLSEALRVELLQDDSLESPLRHAYELLRHEQSYDETVIARHAFLIQAQPHWWGKLRYCARYALSPGSTEWRRVALPASLGLGYRVLRLARVTKFYGQRWLGWHFMHDNASESHALKSHAKSYE